jgi:hypothetical protein
MGVTFVCGLTVERVVYCWSDGDDAVPAQLDGYFTQITADSRSHFGCGIRVDGSIFCWGKRWYRCTMLFVPERRRVYNDIVLSIY